jgi:hypothetical protein
LGVGADGDFAEQFCVFFRIGLVVRLVHDFQRHVGEDIARPLFAVKGRFP